MLNCGMSAKKSILAVTFLALASTLVFAQSAADIFNIPKLEKKTVDADETAWRDTGFKVELMPDASGKLLPAAKFDPKFRLAWNEQGLWVLLTVKDSFLEEHPDMDMAWSRTAFEMFVANKPGDTEYCQLVVSPGCTKAQPQPRFIFGSQKTPAAKENLSAVVVTKIIPGGYISEALFPWKNLGVTKQAGDTAAFQLMVDSFDGKSAFNAVWYPKSNTSRSSASMYPIRLTEKETSPIFGFGASASYERFSRVLVPVVAGSFAAQKKIEVKAGNKKLAESRLELKDGRASSNIVLPMPEPGSPYPPLEVYIEGALAKTLELKDADILRIENFILQKIKFESYCFSTRRFPSADFENPYLVEKLIGTYTIAVDYYDAAGEKVLTAEKPGRYGAVVNIRPARGVETHRFVTLFRSASRLNWRDLAEGVSLTAPDIFGITTDKSKTFTADLNIFAAKQFISGTVSEAESAQLFAGLYDLAKAEEQNQPLALKDTFDLDHKWWVGFKRKYYNYDAVKVINAPRPKEGAPAVTLKEGTLKEAGINPEKMAELEKICGEWGKDFSNGFHVTAARHGVIFLKNSYGFKGPKPFNKAIDGQIASTTKFIAATTFMQLVDQGYVDLDQAVENYLPALGAPEGKRKMTVRDLYMHKTGTTVQWGDDMNDLEEIMADYYPALVGVGEKQNYQGVGLAMGGKIVELLSGEALAEYSKNHLFGPLGCETKGNRTAAGLETTPLDLLKVGQMMLNGGAYGNLRFLNSETVEKMKPIPGKDRIGPDPSVRWGIGIKVFDTDGFSPKAFGHAGANGGFLFMDPEKDLVVSATCVRAGKDYETFKPKFFKAIFDAIEKDK